MNPLDPHATDNGEGVIEQVRFMRQGGDVPEQAITALMALMIEKGDGERLGQLLDMVRKGR